MVVGVCLIAVGAVLVAGPAFGFTSLTADRGVQVSTGDDPGGFLGVIDNSDADEANVQNTNDESLLYFLDDNVGAFSSTGAIDVDVVAFDGDPTSLEATVRSDGDAADYAVVVTCGGSNLNTAGTPTIEVVADGDGVDVHLERTTVNSIDVNCRGGGGGGTGPAGFEADDVDPDGPTQRFRFNADALPSNGDASIDLTVAQANAGVDYRDVDDGDLTLVSGRGDLSFDSNVITFDGRGNQDGTVEIELTGFEITDDRDGTAYYADDADRTDSDTFGVPAVVGGGGDVTTDGDAVVEEGGTAGTIDAGGSVRTGQNANVNGGITAGGDVCMEPGSTSQDIDAGGSVTVDSANINGVITASGDITLRSGSTANGVDAGGTVTLESSVNVNGDITAGGDVVVGDGVTLPNVTAGGTVYIGCDVNENGEIDAEQVVYEC